MPATDFWPQLLNKIPRLAERQWEQAKAMVEKGEFWDAAQRLRFVLWLEPERTEAWYKLGCAYAAIGNKADAEQAFIRALKHAPQNEEIRYMLATLKGTALDKQLHPHSAPAAVMARQFDVKSAEYDEARLIGLEWVAHTTLAKMLVPHVKTHSGIDRAIDLGCGTGLLGMLLPPFAKQLVGVDLSAGMLMQAQARQTPDNQPVYDELIQDDARHFLLAQASPIADLMTALDVWPYIGGLTPVMDGIARTLKPGGLVAFTTELYDGDGYGIYDDSGRFAHSDAYLQEVTARANLVRLEQVVAPSHKDHMVRYSIYQKQAG